MMETIATAAIMIALAHLALGVFLWLRARPFYRYPSSMGFPILGNLYYFYKTLLFVTTTSAYKSLEYHSKKHAENGIFFHWIGGYKLAATVTCPELLKELSFHPNLADKPHEIFGCSDAVVDGPFSNLRSDKEWKLKRKEYNTYLKKSCIDNNYYNIYLKCADRLVNLMSSKASDVDAHVIGTVLDVTMNAFFHIDTNLVYQQGVVDGMKRFRKWSPVGLCNPNLSKVFFSLAEPLFKYILYAKVENLKEMVINDRLNQHHSTEMDLGTEIASRLKKCNMKEIDLLREVNELVLASGHTVASSLVSAIYFLAIHPEIQEKAWKEQYEIFGDDKRHPTLDDLQRMDYLDRFTKETNRFISPPITGRRATADININGVTIPRDTVVIYNLRYMKMNPKYLKNPQAFDPDRYLEMDPSLNIPSGYGVGIRNCPGVYYGTVFLKIALSKLLRRFKLKTVEKNFRLEDITYSISITMDITNPPTIEVEERT